MIRNKAPINYILCIALQQKNCILSNLIPFSPLADMYEDCQLSYDSFLENAVWYKAK